MNKKLSQYDKVLQWLKKYGTITQLEAFEKFACFRLSAIIYLLRKEGYDIETIDTKGKNRYGDTVYFATYKLKKDK